MLKLLNEILITFFINVKYIAILFIVAFVYHLLFK